MTLSDCFLTLLLTLAPMGSLSSFDDGRFKGSACMASGVSMLVNQQAELVLTTKWNRYVIPLPRRIDRTRLSYQMQAEYAYLGDCVYGLRPYFYQDSTCERVMVRFGPVRTY